MPDDQTEASSEHPQHLPSFRRPPVTEVAAGVTFRALDKLTTPLMVEAWQTKFAKTFPKVQEQPAYIAPAENLEMPEMPPRLALSVELAPPIMPRFWFLSEDQEELLQLQRNWFACNWRKVRPDAEYSRWPSIREAFAQYYGQFLAFCESRNVGSIDVEQTEVTYVNHIEPGSAWDTLAHMDRVLRIIGTHDHELFPVEPEQTVIRLSYRIHDSRIRGGRLHVSVEPGLRVQDMKPLIALTLTARTIPAADGPGNVLSAMDVAREWIVKCFAAITTDAAHKQWEQYE